MISISFVEDWGETAVFSNRSYVTYLKAKYLPNISLEKLCPLFILGYLLLGYLLLGYLFQVFWICEDEFLNFY